jgi:hypothetical protein
MRHSIAFNFYETAIHHGSPPSSAHFTYLLIVSLPAYATLYNILADHSAHPESLFGTFK